MEPVEIGDRLQIGFVFDQLFGAAVQETDMGVGALDDLAVHLEHQPHDAVRRRMLRPEIHREIADLRRPGKLAPRISGRRWCGQAVTHAALPAGGASSEPEAFSSPGKILSMPSQGEMKSKRRHSCFSRTGSSTTRFWPSSYRNSTKPVSGKSLRKGCPSKP